MQEIPLPEDISNDERLVSSCHAPPLPSHCLQPSAVNKAPAVVKRTPGLDVSEQLLYEDDRAPAPAPVITAGEDLYGNEEAVKGEYCARSQPR